MAGPGVIGSDAATVRAQYAEARAEWVRLAGALADPALLDQVHAAGDAVVAALRAGRTLLVAGNGGSASMSSHVAAEFAGKCVLDRAPLPAINLAESPTALTAVGNDYGFDEVFTRGLRMFARPGDVFLAMTTSGSSANIVNALDLARDLGLCTIALTGERGEHLRSRVDHLLVVPASSTPRVQEVHLLWCHAWCEAVDHAWQAAPGR